MNTHTHSQTYSTIYVKYCTIITGANKSAQVKIYTINNEYTIFLTVFPTLCFMHAANFR